MKYVNMFARGKSKENKSTITFTHSVLSGTIFSLYASVKKQEF